MISTKNSMMAVFGLLIVVGCERGHDHEEPRSAESSARTRPLPRDIGWVGSKHCGECHEQELARWRGSHHDHSLARATKATVLGAFDGREFMHAGVRSSFSSAGETFRVRTDGPDGVLHDFEVAYVVGVEPLQQYLIAGPGGRLQALSICWDTRTSALGGQRWYHLRDDVLGPDDPLHWTRPAHNYNYVCADCHSTGLRRGYDAERDTFETTWAEIDVACEACHGPGEAHLDWAKQHTPYPNKGLYMAFAPAQPWVIDPASGSPYPHARDERANEVCAPCHSRREPIAEAPRAGDPFLDFFMPELLSPGLYHADGQILDEVYVWGSFMQSRMHEAGVGCGDCHEPHSLELRAEGNELCTRCHDARRFDLPEHHHHQARTEGAACVGCHMPSRVYMGIDARRDHSLRVPRPDLAARFGTPEPCTGCHEDRDAAWAARSVQEWIGSAPTPDFHDGLVLGHTGGPGSVEALLAIAAEEQNPAIIRATALELLAAYPRRELFDLLRVAVASDEPLVRYGVTRAAEALPFALRIALLAPIANDPIRVVRMGVARALAQVPLAQIPAGHRAAVEAAHGTYQDAKAVSSSRPQAQVELGAFEVERGELDAAERAYRRALALEPDYAPARLNLADLHRLRGEDEQAKTQLETLLREHPDHADAHHALGLLLIREGDTDEATRQLARAAKLRPESGRFAYVYAVALASTGEPEAAMAVLEAAVRQHPGDADLGLTLASQRMQAGDLDGAQQALEAVLAVHPEHPGARQLASRLR